MLHIYLQQYIYTQAVFYRLNVATAHGQFMRLFGGAFGVNIGSVLFNNAMNSSFRELEKLTHRHIGLSNIEQFNRLPLPLLRKMQEICFNAFSRIFLLSKELTILYWYLLGN